MTSNIATAARSNDVAKALTAIFKDKHDGKHIDQVERSGKNALHICVEANSLAVAKALLEHKANPNYPATGTHPEWTPLHFAYEHNHMEMVALLTKFGADETIQNFNDELPKDRLEVWKKLQENNRRASKRFSMQRIGNLVKAANKAKHSKREPHAVEYSKACKLTAGGRVGRLTAYLQAEAERKKELDAAREKERIEQIAAATAASLAAGSRSLSLVKKKKKKKPLPSLEDEFCIDDYDEKTGLSPMHIAANNASLEVCKVLAQYKAELNIQCRGKTYKGWTPLHFAYRRNAKSVVQFLLDSKADPTITTDAGVLPEAKKKIWEKEEAKRAKILKTRQAAAQNKETERWELDMQKIHSRVCHAVKGRSLKNLKRVIESRPPPNLDECERSTGFAALHYAAGARPQGVGAITKMQKKGPFMPALRMLLEAKADVNHRTQGGRAKSSTPLHYAYEHNHKEAIALLLEFGADPKAEDADGMHPEDRLSVWEEKQVRRVCVCVICGFVCFDLVPVSVLSNPVNATYTGAYGTSIHFQAAEKAAAEKEAERKRIRAAAEKKKAEEQAEEERLVPMGSRWHIGEP